MTAGCPLKGEYSRVLKQHRFERLLAQIRRFLLAVPNVLDTSKTRKYRDIGRLEPNYVRLEF